MAGYGGSSRSSAEATLHDVYARRDLASSAFGSLPDVTVRSASDTLQRSPATRIHGNSMGFRSNPFRPRSIRGQLVVLIAALAIPLIALQVWWGYQQYQDAVQESDEQALVLAEATATSIRQFLGLSEEILSPMALELGPSWIEGIGCDEAMRTVTNILPFLVNTVAIRADGEIVCSGRPLPPGSSAVDWHWLPSLRASREFTVGSPLLGTLSETWVLPLAAPIVGPGRVVTGAIVGSMPLLEFVPFLEGAQLDDDQLVTVATAENVVIARSHDAIQWIGDTLPLLTGTDEEVAPGRSIARGPDFEGVQRAWGQVQLENGWIVYVGIPAATVLAPARAGVIRHIGATLLVLIAGILLAGASYRRIASALHELATGVRLTADRTTVPLPEATPDEVRDVVERLNQTLRSRTEAEAAERTARARYQSIFENAVFGLYVSTLDGGFLQANDALASMLGYDTTDALIEAGPESLYASPRIREGLIAEVTASGEIEDREVEWLRADGVPITVRLNGRTIKGPDGERAFEMIVQDITDEKRTESELRQTQKMEAIGKLAGGIAHDFNNLLTVIGGNLELMDDSLEAEHPLRSDVEQIREATARASALTMQLLAFARREPRVARLVDVEKVLTNMNRLLVRLIGEDIELETRFECGRSRVSIDAGELEQVLMNLVLNARDAMPRGGKVVIETREAALDLPGASGEGSEDGVLLTVRDTGVGMDYETSKRIFEPFYTTKPMGQGTGLGLSTVYGIVQRVGGHIGVESEPDYGTTIDVWFPRGQGEVAAPAPEEPPFAVTRGTERILVVEDEELVRVFVCRALREAGYSIEVASDGLEALEVLEELEEPSTLR